MRPFRGKWPAFHGKPAGDETGRFAKKSMPRLDLQLIIVLVTLMAATAAYLFVRAQFDGEIARLVQAGFTRYFDGAAWMKTFPDGGVTIIQPGDKPWRAIMAALGLTLAGFMVFACTQEFIASSHRMWSFLGINGLLGLALGVSSLFAPAPRIVEVNAASISVAPHVHVPAAPEPHLAIVPVRENISATSYKIELISPGGAAQTVLTAQHHAQAELLVHVLRQALRHAQKG